MIGGRVISRLKSWLFLILILLPGTLYAQETVCLQCHGSLPDQLGEPVKLWRESIHAYNNISCHSCHGGDPADSVNAMSPSRGFIGVPQPGKIPEFCGRCHIGVMEDYRQSAHGRALDHGGPQCVTCHGNHRVVAATPDLINPRDCSRCHSYGRAEEIRSAVVTTDSMISNIEQQLAALHRLGIDTRELKGEIFALRNDFHRLFHSVDIDKVRNRTAGFQQQLAKIRDHIAAIEAQLASRKYWGGFAVALFALGGILALLIYKTYKKQD
jgi:hypothetical protein